MFLIREGKFGLGFLIDGHFLRKNLGIYFFWGFFCIKKKRGT